MRAHGTPAAAHKFDAIITTYDDYQNKLFRDVSLSGHFRARTFEIYSGAIEDALHEFAELVRAELWGQVEELAKPPTLPVFPTGGRGHPRS